MGRGPFDACAGRVKQKVTNLVKTETSVIHNAHDLFHACKEHLETKLKDDGSCMHFIQTFHFTNKLPTRPKTDSWTTVPDTCKLHSVINSLGSHQNKFEIYSLLLHRMSEWFRVSEQFVSQALVRFQFAKKEVCCT